MKDWPDKCISMTLTSPPYENLRDYKGYVFDFEGIAKELYRITKDGGVVVWVVGDQVINGSESGTSFRQALYFKNIGFNLHDTMIYEKASCIYPGAVRYNQCVEFMFILSKNTPKTVNLITDKQNKYAGYSARGTSHRKTNGDMKNNESFKGKPTKNFGVRNNIWRYGTGWMVSTPDINAYEHPALFPEALATDHIRSWSNPNDIVLDPMNGSGTTCKMAKLLDRRFIGIDISPDYCKIAEERLRTIDTGVPVQEARKGQMSLYA
jgi:site-specific DNA-methyltransferase (adenine-specific)